MAGHMGRAVYSDLRVIPYQRASIEVQLTQEPKANPCYKLFVEVFGKLVIMLPMFSQQ